MPFKRTLRGSCCCREEAIAGLRKTRWLIPASCSSWMRTTRFGRPRPRTSLVMPWVVVLGGTLEGGTRLIGKGINSLLPNLSRKTRKQRAAQEVSEARTWAEENGIQQETPDGKTEFVPEEPGKAEGNLLDRYDAQRTEKVSGIPTDPMVPGGAVTEGKLPDPVDPAVDPGILPAGDQHLVRGGSAG